MPEEIPPSKSVSSPGKAPSSSNADRAQKSILGAVDFDPESQGYTCKRVFAHAGMLMAVPHECPLFKMPQPRQNNVSVNHRDYSAKRSTSCGAKNKPLEPYNPHAQRNRLAQQNVKPGGRNASQIVFGAKDPRQFVTNHHNMHRGFGGIQSTNSSIVAQKTRWFHHLQAL